MKNKISLFLIISLISICLFSCSKKYTYHVNDKYRPSNKEDFKETSNLNITESFDNIYIDWAYGNVLINIASTTETVITSDKFYYCFENNTYYLREYQDGYNYKKDTKKDLVINLSMITSLDKLAVFCNDSLNITGIRINDLVIEGNGSVTLENISFTKGNIAALNDELSLLNITFDELDIKTNNASVLLNTNKKEPNYLVTFNSKKGSFSSNISYTKVENQYGFGTCSSKISFNSSKGSFTLNAKED